MSIRKDIDTHDILNPFHFPEPYELKLRLKDMLEDEVDEKYYLSEAMIEYVLASGTKNYQKPIEVDNEIARTINTTPTSHRSGVDNYITEQYHTTGVPMSTEQVLRIKNATKKGYLEAEEGDGIDISRRMQYHRGTVQKGISQTLLTAGGNNVGVVVKDKSLWTETQAKMITPEGHVKRYIKSDIVDEFKEGQTADISFPKGYGKGKRVYDVCPALTVASVTPIVKESETPLRIRKLTPKECFRLMGFEDDCIDVLIEDGISNTQLYKMAGNSIVVDVLEEIFVELLNLRYVDISSAA